jgi:hypothetical protein
MSFATRNTLVLGVLLVFVLSIGVYKTYFKDRKEVLALDEQIENLDAELASTPDLVNQYNQAQAELTRWEERWNHRVKDIPAQDVTGETNAYLNNAIRLSLPIRIDIDYAGAKQQSNFGYGTYLIRGEASFFSLYDFTSYLEDGQRLLRFPKLTLRQTIAHREGDGDPYPAVYFEAEMWVYYTSLSELSSSSAWSDTLGLPIEYNPFWPLISTEIPANKEGLVDVDQASLAAVIPGKAFVNDQKGRLRALSVGDSVYLGYVSKISPEDASVEFVMNKGGIGGTVTLKVRFRRPEDLEKK